MDLQRRLPSGRSCESYTVDGVEVGLLGEVSSARGVQILVGESRESFRVERLTNEHCLSYLPLIPADSMIAANRLPSRRVRPLNYFAPGVSLEARITGRLTAALCIFSPGFFADLSGVDNQLQFDEIEVLTDIQSERLSYLGRTMFREAIQPGFASSLFAEAIGMAIALEIARYEGALHLNEGRRGGLAPWQIRRLESYVHDHLSDELTLLELARLLGISVRHLSRTVRQTRGVSVHQWIAECRLSEARRLLVDTALPVHEIAQRAAFRSATAFSTAFRAASGFTPGEFRRLNLRQS